MTSERKIAANRRNAAQSTGPRTRAGKARTSRNALLHGLASNVVGRALKSKQVDELTHLIAGAKADASMYALARDAASAELDILKVRAVRAAFFEPLFEPNLRSSIRKQKQDAYFEQNLSEFPGTEIKNRRLRGRMFRRFEQDAELLCAFAQPAKSILNLDRYERRAIARRNRALRQLDALRQTEHE